MPDLGDLRARFDGELLTPDSRGYDDARRPVDPSHQDVFPSAVVRCRSRDDVASAIDHARTAGERIAVRGGGHCFAGRSTTDGLLLDLAALDSVAVHDDGTATIGGGARLAEVYAALHRHGRTLPAGCGPTVGIGGLTLGGGIGLLGRSHGLTCDRLIGAEVVLADGSVVRCDAYRDADLFWALRGAGGAQFGVATSLHYATVAEPVAIGIEGRWPDADPGASIEAWQSLAPDAPDGVTANLTVVAEPGRPLSVHLLGASVLDARSTRHALPAWPDAMLRAPVPFHLLKATIDDPWAAPPRPRMRSEFFTAPLGPGTVRALVRLLREPSDTTRRITFTAMGGAYDHVAGTATAFAHRGHRFLLEHAGATSDEWVDRSWAVAHRDGSGRVYPNFPDAALDDPAAAYHGGNLERLVSIKDRYDPDAFFDFPQAIRPKERQP